MISEVLWPRPYYRSVETIWVALIIRDLTIFYAFAETLRIVSNAAFTFWILLQFIQNSLKVSCLNVGRPIIFIKRYTTTWFEFDMFRGPVNEGFFIVTSNVFWLTVFLLTASVGRRVLRATIHFLISLTAVMVLVGTCILFWLLVKLSLCCTELIRKFMVITILMVPNTLHKRRQRIYLLTIRSFRKIQIFTWKYYDNWCFADVAYFTQLFSNWITGVLLFKSLIR